MTTLNRERLTLLAVEAVRANPREAIRWTSSAERLLVVADDILLGVSQAEGVEIEEPDALLLAGAIAETAVRYVTEHAQVMELVKGCDLGAIEPQSSWDDRWQVVYGQSEVQAGYASRRAAVAQLREILADPDEGCTAADLILLAVWDQASNCRTDEVRL